MTAFFTYQEILQSPNPKNGAAFLINCKSKLTLEKS